MKFILTILTLSVPFLALGQTAQVTNYNNSEYTSPDNFTKNWKADSMGTKGFRDKMIVWDSIQYTYLINGVNIVHFKKKEIIQMLGKPNFDGEIINAYVFGGFFWTQNIPRKTRTINYIINEPCIINGHKHTRYVQLEFRFKKVYEVSIPESCKPE